MHVDANGDAYAGGLVPDASSGARPAPLDVPLPRPQCAAWARAKGGGDEFDRYPYLGGAPKFPGPRKKPSKPQKKKKTD